MLDVVDNLLISGIHTVRLAVFLMAITMVFTVWVKTRSFAPTLAAVLFGAFVWFGAAQTDRLAGLIDDQVDSSEDGPSEEQLPGNAELGD